MPPCCSRWSPVYAIDKWVLRLLRWLFPSVSPITLYSRLQKTGKMWTRMWALNTFTITLIQLFTATHTDPHVSDYPYLSWLPVLIGLLAIYNGYYQCEAFNYIPNKQIIRYIGNECNPEDLIASDQEKLKELKASVKETESHMPIEEEAYNDHTRGLAC